MSFGYQVLGFGAFPNREADYFIENAIMLDGGADYLSWTPSVAGTEETWTFSFWIKKSEFGSEMGLFEVQVDTSNRLGLRYGAASTDTLTAFGDISGSRKLQYNSDGVYRDPTAWQNIVISMNTTDGTASNRFNMWINGQTVSSTSPTYPDEDDVFNINTATTHYIGRRGGGSGYFHGYLAEVIFLDGTASTDASEFGKYDSNGVWVPKDPSETITDFGTNGFHLDFKSADIGNDVSGNNNDFTPSSIGANNVVVDTCSDSSDTDVTLFPCLDPDNKESNITLSSSNLKAENDAQAAWNSVLGTIGLSSGRYYWEITRAYSGHGYDTWGVVGDGKVAGDLNRGSAGAITFDTASGKIRKFVETTSDADYYTSGTGSASGDVIGVDLDVDNDTIELIVGGTGRGTLDTSGLAKPLFPVSMIYSGGSVDHIYNFGSSSYTHTKPSGASNITETVTGVGNYATLNPLDLASSTVLSNGNLRCTSGSNFFDNNYAFSTIEMSSGKFYVTSLPSDTGKYLGIANASVIGDIATANDVHIYWDSSAPRMVYWNGSNNNLTPSPTEVRGFDQLGIALNATNGDYWIGWYDRSGSAWYWYNSSASNWTGNPDSDSGKSGTLSGGPYRFMAGCNASGTHDIDFGQGSLWNNITELTEFKELKTADLAAPTVKDPDDGFALITLENGNTIEASLATARTGWSSFIDVFKREDTNDEDYDVRFSDDSGNSMHFNTNAAAGSELSLASGVNYSAWSWRVGATYGCYTAEISHDNTSATNQAHSLGSGAKSAVAKRSDSTGDWYVSHPNLSSANIRFNVQEATTSELVTVNDTNVTLSTSLPSGTYRVIVWKQIEGFSAFTKYDHDGSTTDGPYVHLGGSASLIAWRNTDSSNYNDFFSTFPSYTSNGNGNPTDVRYNWGNGEKGYSGITIGDVTANGYKMRPSSGSAFGKDADDPMLVWAWGLRPFGGSGVAQARAR
jgi:hypothetical protein